MIIHGDALEHLKNISENTVDLIVTDPPYGIEFMGKDWDKAIPDKEVWQQCYRVLKEGKLAFVMCSPRQDVLSRMILSLDMAGFKTGYTSIYWTYASGFPKAANISKLIDKKNGATREVIGIDENLKSKHNAEVKRGIDGQNNRNRLLSPEFYKTKQAAGYCNPQTVGDITKPATEEAKKMEGAYVGFQPKPAVEIILVVSKGKTLTWLDDCRIPYQSDSDIQSRATRSRSNDPHPMSWNEDLRSELDKWHPEQKGRFPANLLVSDDVLNDGGDHKSGKSVNDNRKNIKEYSNVYGKYTNMDKNYNYDYSDSGSYSRYFDLDKWYSSTFPFMICAKASKAERNEGIDNGDSNKHPTVKPVKLMSYLITLGSRENDLVLDPFCGSGTTLIAAEQLRRKWLGIEINAEYIAITKERLLEETNQWKMDMFVT